jgi:hypothetical protein
LGLLLAEHWPTIGPKLRGKIHRWVGESDQYFLNNAVHLLDDFLRGAEPPAEAQILFGPGKGHGWNLEGLIDRLRAMQTRLEEGRPQSTSAALTPISVAVFYTLQAVLTAKDVFSRVPLNLS